MPNESGLSGSAFHLFGRGAPGFCRGKSGHTLGRPGRVHQRHRDHHNCHGYGVVSIPFAVLIGPDGSIISRELRGEALEAAVVNALAAK